MSRFDPRHKDTPVNEQTMADNLVFLWNDAVTIAEWIRDKYGVERARRSYDNFKRDAVLNFERQNRTLLADFLEASVPKRRTLFRRITVDATDDTKILFLTLALIGVLRAQQVLETCDRFRTVLAHDRKATRFTTAGLYTFAEEIRQIIDYVWPWDLFDSLALTSSPILDEAEGGKRKPKKSAKKVKRQFSPEIRQRMSDAQKLRYARAKRAAKAGR